MALTDGMNAAFVPDRSVDWVEWRLFDPVDGSTNSRVITADGEIVGHVGADVRDSWIHGDRSSVASLGFLYVDAQHRGTEAAKLLVECMYSWRDRDRLSFPISSSAAARVVGDHDRTRMTQWVRWRTGRALARTSSLGRSAAAATLATPVAAVVVGVLTRRARRVARRVEVTDGLASAEDHDELARRSRAFVPALRIRDGRLIDRQWRTNPETIGHAHTRSPDGSLAGHVAWRADPLGGRGQVIELLTGSPEHAAALMAHAADRLWSDGHDVVVFDVLDPRPEMAAAMRGAGFVPRGRGTHVIVHFTHEAVPTARAADWMLTLADTDYV